MNFTTEEILKALREGATDTDLANEFAKSLNEATKLHAEESAKAKAEAAKEAIYEDCADAFTAVLAAEGIEDPVTPEDIHAIVDSIKNAGTFLESLVNSLDKALSTFDKPKKLGKRTPDSDDEIIRSFLAAL